jgi:broad specificity phosphatase PhoE
MVTFYLIRHGTKEAVPFDPPLTKIGVIQAQATAEYLKTIPFKAVYSSQKKRAQQTAQIIVKQLQLPVMIDKRLQERLEWEKNESFEEFIAEWIKTDLDRNYKPKKGMSSNANGIQIKKVIDKISNIYNEGNILIVSHGGSIGDLLRCCFPKQAIVHKTEPISGAKYINILECSITVIQKVENEYRLLKLGDISHLPIPLI